MLITIGEDDDGLRSSKWTKVKVLDNLLELFARHIKLLKPDDVSMRAIQPALSDL